MDDGQRSFHLGPDDDPDKYRLLQQFGAGGEAQLWRAVLTLAGASEPVAVKVLRPELHDDFGMLSRRWSEQAELLRFVRHPGVVGVREHFEGAPVHAAGQARTTPGRSLCLVMNWVEGHSLRDWVVLNPGVDGLLRSVTHLEQVAEVLDWLHSGRATPSGRVVVHGDLSPGNIIVGEHGQAVLVDFGLTRVAAHRTAQPAFTPGYAAPEVWSAGEYSPAADRYGFGAVGYFLLTGENPPPDPQRVRAGLAAVPIIGGGDPQRLEALVSMFDPDPARRPSALEWVRTLRAGATTAARRYDARAAATVGPDQTPTMAIPAATPRQAPPQQQPPAGRPRRRWRARLIALAAVLLVAGGVTAGLLLPGLLGGTAGAGVDPAAAAVTSTTAVPTTTLAPTTTRATPTPSVSAGPSTAPVGSGAITYLGDLDAILGTWDRRGTIEVDGRVYTHALADTDCGSQPPRDYEYNLGRAYSSFDTLLGLSDATESSAQFKIEAFRDGLPVGTWTLQRGKTELFELDVRGALTLKFTVSTINPQQTCNGGLTLADPKLVS